MIVITYLGDGIRSTLRPVILLSRYTLCGACAHGVPVAQTSIRFLLVVSNPISTSLFPLERCPTHCESALFLTRARTDAGLVGSAHAADPTTEPVLLALSGIKGRRDVQGYRAGGVHGVLVGEALMRAPDPTALISSLRGTHSRDVLVKICGFTTADNAAVAAAAGADMLGLVFAPGSKRLVSPTTAKAIGDRIKAMFPRERSDVAKLLHRTPDNASGATGAAEWYHQGATRLRAAAAVRPLLFGVFANQPVDEVNAIAEAAGLDVIQLSGTEGMAGTDAYCRPVVKAVHIADGDAVEDIVAKITAGRPLAVWWLRW